MVDLVLEIAGLEGDGADEGGLRFRGGDGVGVEGLEDIGQGLVSGATLRWVRCSSAGIGGWGYRLELSCCEGGSRLDGECEGVGHEC